ncbi:MAG: formyl transferase [Phototrophicaceae bacterium]|jgi:folate-dependent phosphoribosylglycinamide formyltransferase PurN
MNPPPIVIFASRSRTSYALIHALADQFSVAAVVFEHGQGRKLLRYRLKTLGWLRVLGQLAFLAYDRLIIRPRSEGKINALLADYNDAPPDNRLRCMDVDSINGEAVQALLQEIQPACVVVSGTGIIRKKILALSDTFINIHTGITPRYRGVHGAFWAVYEGRPELAGVTIHLIDAGIDTGGILAQASITVDPAQDTYRTLPVKQYLVGLPLMVEQVAQALAGELAPYQRSDLESQQWYSPNLTEYIRFVIKLTEKAP